MNDGKVATLWNGEFQYSMESFSIQLRASVFNWEFQYSIESFSIQWRASVFTWELQYSLESFSTRWRAPPRSRNSEQRSRRRTCRTESGRFSCVIASIFCDWINMWIKYRVITFILKAEVPAVDVNLQDLLEVVALRLWFRLGETSYYQMHKFYKARSLELSKFVKFIESTLFDLVGNLENLNLCLVRTDFSICHLIFVSTDKYYEHNQYTAIP